MAESGAIKGNARGGAGNGVIRIGGKSINMIRSQRDRILDSFRDAYYNAENGNPAEIDDELERLNKRLTTMNETVNRYEANISEQPEYQDITRRLRETFRNGGRSPEEARETARRINELNERRRSIRYPRSVYANNRR